MDKNAIKKYATWARRELITRVSQKAEQYGITEKEIADERAESIHGVMLTPAQVDQRQALIQIIRRDGYRQAMEEVAYTWFNRFIALRFMEVNDYLPNHTRAFTDERNAFKPKILSDALNLELTGLSLDKVIELKETKQTEALYQYLLITLCNHLSAVLPGMFQQIDDYTDLLFPEHLLREGSALEQLVLTIPEDNWKDAVQIVGWLYQYYNAEPKEQVFANLKKNIKISKENIPAATQLFTPDWIVRYMVENSLGRLYISGQLSVGSGQGAVVSDQWSVTSGQETTGSEEERIEKEKEIAERMGWRYYLPEAAQTPAVRTLLTTAHCPLTTNLPTWKLIDPCMGSGHILVYMFDVLVQIYEACGYPTRDAVASIVQNNLWGLDIDDRAAQLASFAVMMKARQYDKGWFRRGIQPHVMAIRESNGLNRSHLRCLGNTLSDLERNNATTQIEALLDAFIDAKEYGSVLRPQTFDWEALRRFVRMTVPQQQTSLDEAGIDDTQERLMQLIGQAEALTQKYHAVVTNPPYMGASNMNPKLNEFIKNKYADYKSDFFSAFIVRASEMTTENGYCGFFTPYVWMFIQSYEKLRQYLYHQATIETLIQFEYSAFEEATVPVCTFVFSNSHIADKKGNYLRLVDFRGGMDVQCQKTLEAIADHNCGYYYEQTTDNFSKIPGAPVAYWVSEKILKLFGTKKVCDYGEAKSGMTTTDNSRFLRLWSEVNRNNIGFGYANITDTEDKKYRWFPFCKGGDFRRWAGNEIYVVNWYDNGKEIRKAAEGATGGRLVNVDCALEKCVVWTKISSAKISLRIKEEGVFFSDAAPGVFAKPNKLHYLLGILNTKYSEEIIKLINPTLNFVPGAIASVPVGSTLYQEDNISGIVASNIAISKSDWDSYETSWDFKRHPLVSDQWAENSGQWSVISGQCEDKKTNHYPLTTNHYPLTTNHLKMRYEDWKGECEERFLRLKQNEESLNRIFISVYGLQDELTPDVADKDITVHRIFDTKDDVPESMKGSNYVRTMRDEIVSLLSYAVGCMFGRYSLDADGLAYAGGEFSDQWSVTSGQCEDKKTNHYPLTTNNFPPDKDGILPITDDDYFADDIVTLFVRWVETVYGADTLEENLKFIANALYPSGGGTARELIRRYFLNDFYADHLKTYQKRPIYWLFDAGKKNSLKCLIYLHRYRPDTVARVRTDYVHEMQARYRTAIEELTRRVDTASGAERVRLQKTLTKLGEQDAELRKYEEKIHHYADMMLPLDLDDGVKVNYAKLQDVLAPIK